MYCVIGGSGFIGTRLVSRLVSKGQKVSIVDKKLSQSYPDLSLLADVRSDEQLQKVVEGGVIINLAAEHRDDVSPKSLYHEVNVSGAKNICAIAKSKRINKIIFTSSVAVYGFAPIGTGEDGEINPFNEYGKTKYEAENIFKNWQKEDPENRSLAIIRPTVVFGEGNRGNVYNLLKQIASGKFLMIGSGRNRKSMAYVENVSAFIEYCADFGPGVQVFNFIDKPDFDMNTLVSKCRNELGLGTGVGLRLPYFFGLIVGFGFDVVAKLLNRKFSISSIRVKKFCSNSVYSTAIDKTDFVRPVTIEQALLNTLKFEFVEDNSSGEIFFTE
jgi:GlcNAc-P-P-Und epimerase